MQRKPQYAYTDRIQQKQQKEEVYSKKCAQQKGRTSECCSSTASIQDYFSAAQGSGLPVTLFP